jgi:hypothetical protein
MLLRQSTAVVVQFGPFVDKTDAVTLETGLVSALDHGTTGIFLSKNGGTLTIRHAAVTASSYDAHGCYKVTLDTTDTNTLGTLRVIYTDAATCLPVWQDFMVITANEWDSMCAAAIRAANTTQVSGTAQTAGDLAAMITVVDDYVDTEVAAIKAKTDLIPASPAAVGSAMTLTSGERTSIATAYADLADGIETGITPRQGNRVMLAAAAGKVDGASTTTVHLRDQADTKNRVTATVDAYGNRTAITLDVS